MAYEKCPITDYRCCYCGSTDKVQYCGIGNKTKQGIVNKIKEMKLCPVETKRQKLR